MMINDRGVLAKTSSVITATKGVTLLYYRLPKKPIDQGNSTTTMSQQHQGESEEEEDWGRL